MFSPAIPLKRLPVLTELSHIVDTTNATSWTLSDVTIPRAGVLIACVSVPMGGGNNRTVSTITVEGDAMTIHQTQSAFTQASVVASRVETARTVTPVVTMSGTGAMNIAVTFYLLENYDSATPHGIGYSNDNISAVSESMTMDVPDNGIAVCSAFHWGGADDTAWTGATVARDDNIEAGNNRHSTATYTDTIKQTGRTFTATHNSQNGCIAGCSWK